MTSVDPRLEVRSAPFGGLGVFATTSISRGSLVIEPILIKVSTDHIPNYNRAVKHTWRETMLAMRHNELPASAVADAMAHLTPEQLSTFRNAVKDVPSDVIRFHIVSYDLCPVFGRQPSAFGATGLGPYMNHSCVGNLQYSYAEPERSVHLYALQDIKQGEEVKLCYYVDATWMRRAERKAELQAIYDFECGCEACAGEGGEDRRVRISETQKDLWIWLQKRTGLERGGDHTSAEREMEERAERYVNMVEEELGGLDAEGLPSRADARLAVAYRLAARCTEDSAKADLLTEKATKVSEICFGKASPHFAMQDHLLEDLHQEYQT